LPLIGHGTLWGGWFVLGSPGEKQPQWSRPAWTGEQLKASSRPCFNRGRLCPGDGGPLPGRSPAPSRWPPDGPVDRTPRSADPLITISSHRRNLRRFYEATTLAHRAQQAPRRIQVRWYPTHGDQHDQPSQVQAPSLPVVRAPTVKPNRPRAPRVMVALDCGSHIKTRSQPWPASPEGVPPGGALSQRGSTPLPPRADPARAEITGQTGA
jgi:hypothetical protein